MKRIMSACGGSAVGGKKWLIIPIAMIGIFMFAQASWAAATITGQIYNTVGETVTGAQCAVNLYDDAGLYINSTVTSSVDGTFSFADVTAGEYQFLFSNGTGCELQNDYFYSVRKFYVIDGATTNQNVWLDLVDQQGTVRGRLVDSSGAPIADAWVSIQKKESVETASAYYSYAGQTDSTGKFNISNLAPGTYEITVNSYSGYCPNAATCLPFVYRDFTPVLGGLTDLGDINFYGSDRTLNLMLKEWVGEEPSLPLKVDRFSIMAYALDPDPNNPGQYLSTGPEVASASCPSVDGKISYCDINITSTHQWYVSAVGIDGTLPYYGNIVIPAGTETSADIVLSNLTDWTLNNSVDETFSSQDDHIITFDENIVTIPAYAIDTDAGNVNVVIEPAFDLPTMDYPIEGFVYNLTAYNTHNEKVTSFNRPIQITYMYNISRATELGIAEEDLVPSYFDEDENVWYRLLPQQYSFDYDADKYTMSVNHFSQYAIVADRFDDILNKTSNGNETIQTRSRPNKVKDVRVPRKHMNIDENAKWNGTLRVSWKKQSLNKATRYYVKFWENTSKASKMDVVLLRKTLIKNFSGKDRAYLDIPISGWPNWEWNLGKEYIFKVRAYNHAQGRTLYGAWSKPITVTVAP